jgi:hypothetical protein
LYEIKDIEFQFYNLKSILNMDSCVGCTILWIYVILLNCMLKIGSDSKFYKKCEKRNESVLSMLKPSLMQN